jgi:hypothetical protein
MFCDFIDKKIFLGKNSHATLCHFNIRHVTVPHAGISSATGYIDASPTILVCRTIVHSVTPIGSDSTRSTHHSINHLRISGSVIMKRAILCLTLLLSACHPYYLLAPNNTGYIVRVEADGEWEGVVDNQRVSGFNTAGIPVYPRLGRSVCWDIGKSRPYTGMLRAFLTYRDYYSTSDMHPRFGDSVTLSMSGRVSGCVQP